METTITGIVYLYMLQQFLIPQLDDGRIRFQQDDAPPHYLEEVREYLNTRFPGRWIGHLIPRILNPWIFFLWRFVKDSVLITSTSKCR
jgi:hypothetical protein